jgi:hypothetical protein
LFGAFLDAIIKSESVALREKEDYEKQHYSDLCRNYFIFRVRIYSFCPEDGDAEAGNGFSGSGRSAW